MSSSKSSSEIEIRATPADVRALTRFARDAAGAVVDYLLFLSRFPAADVEALRRREGPRGEPFRL